MEFVSSALPIAFFLLCLGGVFVGGAVIVFLLGKPFEAKSETNGTVIAIETDKDEPDVFMPVVRFTARNGQTCTFRSRVGSGTPTHTVGQTVPVLYSTNNPQTAEIKGQSQLLIIILGIFGLCLLCAGAVVGLLSLAGGF